MSLLIRGGGEGLSCRSAKMLKSEGAGEGVIDQPLLGLSLRLAAPRLLRMSPIFSDIALNN